MIDINKRNATITAYIDFNTKTKWDNWIKQHNYKMTTLIIDSVKYYIENYETIVSKEEFSNKIRQILTPISGYIEMALESCPNDAKETSEFLNEINKGYTSLNDYLKRYYDTINSEAQEVDILYIEDDKPTTRMVTKHVKRRGYTIKNLETAEKCLEDLESLKLKPKLILIDLSLRKDLMQGEELCKQLKSNNLYKKIPIVLISAMLGDYKDAEKVKIENKADYIIIKPFKFDEFDAIFKFLNK